MISGSVSARGEGAEKRSRDHGGKGRWCDAIGLYRNLKSNFRYRQLIIGIRRCVKAHGFTKIDMYASHRSGEALDIANHPAN